MLSAGAKVVNENDDWPQSRSSAEITGLPDELISV